jgi:sugar phosphate isomerase/epimerase
MFKHHQLAIQFYTLRDHCKTAHDLMATCKKVYDIGYRTIQLSGIGPIPDSELRKIIAESGLSAPCSHENLDDIRKNPQKVIDRMKLLGVTHTAYAYPAGVDFNDMASVDALCADLDRAGALLREAGLTLSYHNHDIEFYRLANGKILLEYIFEKTSPQNLQAEIDTYWVQAGGGCPIFWSGRYKGRAPMIHLKDCRFLMPERKLTYCEIGSGTLPWHSILPAAKEAGTQYYIVEQDTCPGDPFDSIKKSYDYLSRNYFTEK